MLCAPIRSADTAVGTAPKSSICGVWDKGGGLAEAGGGGRELAGAGGAGISRGGAPVRAAVRAASAPSLFDRSPFDFERWAVSRINAQPDVKQVGGKGVDGMARFYRDKETIGGVLVSVQGGKAVGPLFLRDLSGSAGTQKAQMGVLITMAEPAPGVLGAVDHGGTCTWPVNGQTCPGIGVITGADLLHGIGPAMRPLMLPYIRAAKALPAVAPDDR